MAHRTRRSGFSLVELLVVLAVVAILLAILAPSLSKARRQAHVVRCASNLREIGLGWAAYRQDHRGEYPADNNAHQHARTHLQPYLPVVEVFRCPADRVIWPQYVDRADQSRQNSYAMSPVLMGRRHRPDLPPWHPLNAPRVTWPELDERVRGARVVQPTVAEAALVVGGDYDWLLALNRPPATRTAEYTFHPPRDHNNLLFYDGHVAFLRVYYRYYITPHYTLNPYRDLVSVARDRELVGP